LAALSLQNGHPPASRRLDPRSDEHVIDTPAVPSVTGRRKPSARIVAALAVAALAIAPRIGAAQKDIPLPPPPPGMKRIPLPPPPPGMKLQTRPTTEPPGVDRCTGCHSKLTQGRIMHGVMTKHECSVCHRAVTAEAGKCKSRTASKWVLVRTEPELCYANCHARKDEAKSVHTVVRQGSCLSCHAAHSSDFAGLLKAPREKVCFECHDSDTLLTKPVKHAPVSEGRCLDCHDAHGSAEPAHVKADIGKGLCLKCHAAKAPTGKGTPGPAYRVDMEAKFVHSAFKKTDCLGCHDGGHGSDNLKLLKKNAVDLCYGCHERKDKNKFPHGAVVVGDCATCHEPHASNNSKRLTKATLNETCFVCHQDDLTGRKSIHAPIAKGCDQCHDSHGAQSRNALKTGEGKAGCYKCHKPVDTGKNKHMALERYGCIGCHDAHAADNAVLVTQKVNDLCGGCHPEQKDGRHVSPIVSRGHAVGGDLVDPRRPGRAFTCASCHNPHGSDHPKLFYYGATTMQSCDWCHGDKTGKNPSLKNVVSQARPKAPAAVGTGGGAPGGGSGSGSGAPGGGTAGGGAAAPTPAP
jgi:predicted CXXCH cytochrome family protein